MKTIAQLAEEAGFMQTWFSESGDNMENEIRKFAKLLIEELANRVQHAIDITGMASDEYEYGWDDGMRVAINTIQRSL